MLLGELEQQGVTVMHSLTSDGDSECHSVAQDYFPNEVLSHRDANHYSKGLIRNIEELAVHHPSLIPVVPALRSHFYACLAYYGKNDDEPGFRRQWKTFIPHITNTDHSCCLHAIDKETTLLLDPGDPAKDELAKLMDAFLEDAHQVVHPYDTNHLEALNGTYLLPFVFLLLKFIRESAKAGR